MSLNLTKPSCLTAIKGNLSPGTAGRPSRRHGAKFTAQALDALIATLKNEGYTFVPVSELIYRDGYHMNHEGSR